MRPRRRLSITGDRGNKTWVAQSNLESRSNGQPITIGFTSRVLLSPPKSSLAMLELWALQKVYRRYLEPDTTRCARYANAKKVPASHATNVVHQVCYAPTADYLSGPVY